MNTEEESNVEKIFRMLDADIKQCIIWKELGLSKGYVSKIAKKYNKAKEEAEKLKRKAELDEIKNAWYFKFYDHGLVENKDKKDLPIMKLVGIIEDETENSYSVKHIWSETLGKVIRRFIIGKGMIIEKKKYELVDKE